MNNKKYLELLNLGILSTQEVREVVLRSVGLQPSGTYAVSDLDNWINPSGSSPDPRLKNLSIEERKCPYCKYVNRIDYSRLPAIAVLNCGNCGGILE